MKHYVTIEISVIFIEECYLIKILFEIILYVIATELFYFVHICYKLL